MEVLCNVKGHEKREQSKQEKVLRLLEVNCKCWTPYLPPVTVFYWRPENLYPKPGVALNKSRAFPKVENFIGVFGNKICPTGTTERLAPKVHVEGEDEEAEMKYSKSTTSCDEGSGAKDAANTTNGKKVNIKELHLDP